MEISYLNERVGKLRKANSHDHSNPTVEEMELRINGKLQHIFRTKNGNFIDTISFPSGKVLR